MKMTNLGNSQTSGVTRMDDELKNKLCDKTVNQALRAHIIDDVATDDGAFIVPHADPNIDEWYAIIQGSGVRVSSGVKKLIEDGDERMGDNDFLGTLTFSKGFSREKFKDGEVTTKDDPNGDYIAWFRLGLPQEYNLDTKSKDAVRIGAVPVNTRK